MSFIVKKKKKNTIDCGFIVHTITKYFKVAQHFAMTHSLAKNDLEMTNVLFKSKLCVVLNSSR